MNHRIFLLIVTLVVALPATAQNTGGVFPPIVNEGHKSWQYRVAVDPNNDAGETGIAQRLHYQQAINDDFMWRIIGQARKTDDSTFDFDFVQAEMFWDLSEDDQDYRTGIRVDARLRDEDRPDQIGLNWTNQFYFDNNWSARAVLLTAFQVGDNAADGVFLQTRWQLANKLENGHTVGLEMYNSHGSTDDFGGFDSQSHALGPIWAFPVKSGWSVFSGILFGLSDASPDTEARIWIVKSI